MSFIYTWQVFYGNATLLLIFNEIGPFLIYNQKMLLTSDQKWIGNLVLSFEEFIYDLARYDTTCIDSSD